MGRCKSVCTRSRIFVDDLDSSLCLGLGDCLDLLFKHTDHFSIFDNFCYLTIWTISMVLLIKSMFEWLKRLCHNSSFWTADIMALWVFGCLDQRFVQTAIFSFDANKCNATVILSYCLSFSTVLIIGIKCDFHPRTPATADWYCCRLNPAHTEQLYNLWWSIYHDRAVYISNSLD